MANYCRKCGQGLNPQRRFCPNCGLAVHSEIRSVEESEQNENYLPEKKRGRGFVPLVAMVLIIAVALYGWPGFLRDKNIFTTESSGDKNSPENENEEISGTGGIELTEKDYNVEPIVVELKAGSTTAQAGNIEIDFGELNINEDTRLEVRDLGVRKDSLSGKNAQLYDFTIGGDGEFLGVVTITVPCSDKGKTAKYLNTKTGVWESVYSKVDEPKGTMTIYTTHFSTFGVFDGFEYAEGYNSGPLSEVRYNGEAVDKLLENWEADNAVFLKMMINSKVGKKILANAFLKAMDHSGTVTTVGEAGTNIAEEALEFIGSSKVNAAKTLGKQLSYIGAGLTALKVALDWYDSGSFTDSFKKNRGAILVATVSVTAAALGSTTLGVVGAIIWAVNTTNAEVESLRNGGYEGAREHAYFKFTFEYGAYSPSEDKFCVYLPNRMYSRAILENEQPEMAMADAIKADETTLWGKFIKEEFLKHRSNPEKIFEGIDARIDKFMNVFWKLTPKVRKAIAEEIHKADEWKEPSKSEIKKLKLAAKAKMHLKLRRYYGLIYERLLLDAKTKLLWELEDLEKTMNAVTDIRVVEIDEDGKEQPLSSGKYKSYAAAIVASPDAKPGTWSWKPGSRNNPNFRCTLYNYLAAGSPKYVNFYESWDDLVENKAEFSKEFVFDRGEVKIVISDSSLSAEEIAGTYKLSVTSTTWYDGDKAVNESKDAVESKREFKVSDGVLYFVFKDLDLKLSFDPKTGKAYGEYEYAARFQQKIREVYEFTFSRKGSGIIFEGMRTSHRAGGKITYKLKGKKQ